MSQSLFPVATPRRYGSIGIESRCTGAIALALLLAPGCGAPPEPALPEAISSEAAGCPVAAHEGLRCEVRLGQPSRPIAPALSPDGRYIAFEIVEGDDSQVGVYDLEAGTQRVLTTGPGARYDPAWSPDGTRLAVWGRLPDAFGEVARGIGLIDAVTGAERLAFRSVVAIDTDPVWTPAGRIVFVHEDIIVAPAARSSAAPSPRRHRLWIMDGSGADAEPFLPGYFGQPVFSPDGERLAFLRPGCGAERKDVPGLWVADRSGGNARCALALGPGPHGFAFGSDGEAVYLAGSTSADSARGLYRVDPAGDEAPHRLPAPPGELIGLDVARSGQVAVFAFRDSIGTEMWTLTSTVSLAGDRPADRARPARPVPVALEPDPIGLHEVGAAVLHVARSAEASAPLVRGLWPSLWDGSQAYGLRSTDEPPEALVVAPVSTPAGFRPVAGAEVPPELSRRLFHARGVSARIENIFYDVPVVPVPPGVESDPRALEETLFELYRNVMLDPDARLLPAIAPRGEGNRSCRSECPARDPRCEALARVEVRILREAAFAIRRVGGTTADTVRRMVRDLAAIHWLRTDAESTETRIEHREGIAANVARRAAMLAAGRDTAAYLSPLNVALAPLLPEAARTPAARRRLVARGQMIASLLDWFGPEWRDEVRGGTPPAEVLLGAGGLTKTTALQAAARAIEAYDYEDELRRLTGYPLPRVNELLYLGALCALSSPTSTVQIDLPGARTTAGHFILRYEAGQGGAVSLEAGDVFLPDPEIVEIDLGDLRIEARGSPIGIVREPGFRDRLRIMIYPAEELEDRIRDQAGNVDGAAQYVRVRGLELEVGPAVRVSRRPGAILLTVD